MISISINVHISKLNLQNEITLVMVALLQKIIQYVVLK